jgi:hypothetical protein
MFAQQGRLLINTSAWVSQSRRFGDVCDWSAYSSIAVELMRCSETTESARRDRTDGGANAAPWMGLAAARWVRVKPL